MDSVDADFLARSVQKVEGFRTGDRVMGMFPEGATFFCVVNRRALSSLPGGLTSVQAATIPVCFLTAWYALVKRALATLSEGMEEAGEEYEEFVI